MELDEVELEDVEEDVEDDIEEDVVDEVTELLSPSVILK